MYGGRARLAGDAALKTLLFIACDVQKLYLNGLLSDVSVPRYG
jgi:hypothetical protein